MEDPGYPGALLGVLVKPTPRAQGLTQDRISNEARDDETADDCRDGDQANLSRRDVKRAGYLRTDSEKDRVT